MPRNADFIQRRRIKLIWSNTELPRIVARGPRASQCRLYPETSNQLIWSNTELPRIVARGPRASQCRLYPETSNQVNVVQST